MTPQETSRMERIVLVFTVALALLAFLSLDRDASARPFLTPQDPRPAPPGLLSTEGGSIYSADGGFQAVIPPGALPYPVIITAYPITRAPSVKGYTVIGQPYCFTIWDNGQPILHINQAVLLVRRGFTKAAAGREKSLTLALYDEKVNAWRPFLSNVNLASRTVDGKVSDFLAASFCDKSNKQVLVALVLPTTTASKSAVPAKITRTPVPRKVPTAKPKP